LPRDFGFVIGQRHDTDDSRLRITRDGVIGAVRRAGQLLRFTRQRFNFLH
jgi:hypothetical protein